jgi:hypothetical protein
VHEPSYTKLLIKDARIRKTMPIKPSDGLRVQVGISFKPDVLANLEEYSESYFDANRSKAVNAILAEFFRKRQDASSGVVGRK